MIAHCYHCGLHHEPGACPPSDELTVIGRNGYEYDAEHIIDDLYRVGRYVVRVKDGKVGATICRATKENIRLITPQPQKKG